MGLDMYLYRKTYVKNWDHMKEEDLHQISVNLAKKKHPHIDVTKISEITESVGYWRKANAIHKWFVDNCQNGVDECQESYVSWENLEELLNICKQIIEDPKKSEDLLPTQQGFFFGGSAYDEWYLQSIQSTIEILEPLVKYNQQLTADREAGKSIRVSPEFAYRSSW